MSGALPLSSLEAGLSSLSAMPASDLDARLQGLLRPMAVQGASPAAPAASLPSLAALPPSAHANLALLLRCAPHRFTAAQRAALLEGLARVAAAASRLGGGSGDSAHVELLELLAPEADDGWQRRRPARTPPCPAFLYTRQPCLPWAPMLADAAELRRQQLREAAAQPVAAGAQAAGAKRPFDAAAADGAGVAAKRTRPEQAAPTQAVTPSAAAAAANNELEAAVAAVGAVLGGGAALPSVPPQLRAALDTLLTHAAAGAAASSGGDLLEAAGLHSLADDGTLLVLVTVLVAPGSSFARCSAAAAGLLLPRLTALEGPASRDLKAAAEHVAAANPLAFIAACLRPLLGRPGLNKHQGEMLSSTVKSGLPPQLLPEVVAAACAPAAGGAAGGSAWTEHTAGVLQAVLNARPALTPSGVAQLAAALLAAATAGSGSSSGELAASPKFAKLVLSVVKQCPEGAAGSKAALQAVAAATRSFMSKSLLAAVAKL